MFQEGSAGWRAGRCTQFPSLGNPDGKLHPQLCQSQWKNIPVTDPMCLPASQAGTPDCSRLSHSHGLTFPAPISWERSCAANEHMKGFISPGRHVHWL